MGLFEELLNLVSVRWRVFTLFNVLFFGCVFVAVLVAEFVFPPLLDFGWSAGVPEVFVGGGWFVLFLLIFVFNVGVSGFLVVTLPGFVFFPLSVVSLVVRGVLWGLLVYGLPGWFFVAVLPTLVLEGEAYVFAAVGGVIGGVSWIKPRWLGCEEGLSRVECFRRGLRECLRVYVFVVLLLFVAAVVETATIVLVG